MSTNSPGGPPLFKAANPGSTSEKPSSAGRATGRASKTIKYPNGSLYVRRRDLAAWLNDHVKAA